MLKQSALRSTSVSGVQVCQLILRIRRRHLWWNLSGHSRCRRYVVQVSNEYRRVLRTDDLYTLILVFREIVRSDHTLFSNFPKAAQMYFSIQGSLSRQSAPEIYESVSYIQSGVIYNYIWLILWFAWCGCENLFRLFQTYCEPECSANKKETIHYKLHVFYTVSNKDSIVSYSSSRISISKAFVSASKRLILKTFPDIRNLK